MFTGVYYRMSTTEAGRDAEKLVADELKKQGHKIISMNWRTRWCEIDIVSKIKNTVYFTEVKYRSSDQWGSGLEYINNKKLKQIQFAAEFWISENNWVGESVLLGAEVDSEGTIELVEITS